MEEVEDETLDDIYLEKVPLTRKHNSPVWSDFELWKDKRNEALYGKCIACEKILKVRKNQLLLSTIFNLIISIIPPILCVINAQKGSHQITHHSVMMRLQCYMACLLQRD